MDAPLLITERRTPALESNRLTIGCLIFPRLDQIDFTGPFEVLSRLPDVDIHVIAKTREPLRDMKGLILTPEMTIAESPPLDVLVVPGGFGQRDLMRDDQLLSLIRNQAESGRWVFSICTGALLCGAAGILSGRHATTHWTAWDLLPYYGAIAAEARVVVDGNLVSSSGVTAGLDGALVLASLLRGETAAEIIQLSIQYVSVLGEALHFGPGTSFTPGAGAHGCILSHRYCGTDVLRVLCIHLSGRQGSAGTQPERRLKRRNDLGQLFCPKLHDSILAVKR